MADRGAVDDVEPGRAPPLGRLGERRRGSGGHLELSWLRDAQCRELAGDPAGASFRVAAGSEGAGVAVRALTAAEAVLHAVARLSVGRLSPLDPHARHEPDVPGRRDRCAARRARGSGLLGSSVARTPGARPPGACGRRRRSPAARVRAHAGASESRARPASRAAGRATADATRCRRLRAASDVAVTGARQRLARARAAPAQHDAPDECSRSIPLVASPTAA